MADDHDDAPVPDDVLRELSEHAAAHDHDVDGERSVDERSDALPERLDVPVDVPVADALDQARDVVFDDDH